MAGEIVLDAQPVISLLADEASAPLVQEHLKRHADRTIVISAVNWCEVLYFARRVGEDYEAAGLMGLLQSLPLRVVAVDADMAGHAAALKSRFGLGLGDCFAAGLALALDAPLMTGDSDFTPLQEHGLKVLWAR